MSCGIRSGVTRQFLTHRLTLGSISPVTHHRSVGTRSPRTTGGTSCCSGDLFRVTYDGFIKSMPSDIRESRLTLIRTTPEPAPSWEHLKSFASAWVLSMNSKDSSRVLMSSTGYAKRSGVSYKFFRSCMEGTSYFAEEPQRKRHFGQFCSYLPP